MDPYKIPASRVARVSELMARPGTKAKASVTIARGLLDAADTVAGQDGRSALIERAVRYYIRRRSNPPSRSTNRSRPLPFRFWLFSLL